MGLVYGSWCDSYARTHHARACGHAYKAIQDAIVKRHCARSAVLVCCLEDDPETIVGWSCTDEGTVHFVYTKFKWRNRGVAKLLLAPFLAAATTHTHVMTLDDDGEPWRNIPKGWSYDPHANYGL